MRSVESILRVAATLALGSTLWLAGCGKYVTRAELDARLASAQAGQDLAVDRDAIDRLERRLADIRTSLKVAANNLANANTAAFKAEQCVAVEGRLETRRDLSVGSPIDTGRPLDVMIDGQGFFKVEASPEEGGIAYTRTGNFFVNNEGDLVMGNADGRRILPAINVPTDAESVHIDSEGRVRVTQSDQSEPMDIGSFELTYFNNTDGLKSIGGNCYIETVASGPPIDGNPREGPLGGILQGYLEASNVDGPREELRIAMLRREYDGICLALERLTGVSMRHSFYPRQAAAR